MRALRLTFILAAVGLGAEAWAQSCPVSPLLNCNTAERSSLVLRNDPVDSRDRMIWRWQKGEPTQPTDFNDPTGTTHYLLCVYGGAAASLRPGHAVSIAPSSTTWSPKRGGYKLKDKTGGNDGITAVSLRGDPLPSRSSALVKGKGPNLPDPALMPVATDFPLVVQLINADTNFCLQSTFMGIDTKRNDATQLVLKNQ